MGNLGKVNAIVTVRGGYSLPNFKAQKSGGLKASLNQIAGGSSDVTANNYKQAFPNNHKDSRFHRL